MTDAWSGLIATDAAAIAAAAALVALLLATPLAAWAAGGRHWYHRLSLGLTLLPLLVPAALLISLLDPDGSVGTVWRALWRDHATAAAQLAGAALYALPYPALLLYHWFGRVPRPLLQASATLGAGPLDRFLSVTLPHSRGALTVAAILAFSQAAGAAALWRQPGHGLPALALAGLALLALTAILLTAPQEQGGHR